MMEAKNLKAYFSEFFYKEKSSKSPSKGKETNDYFYDTIIQKDLSLYKLPKYLETVSILFL